MKSIFLFTTLIFCFVITDFKCQNELYSGIQVNTIPTEYTVTATNDSVFARELVIDLLNIDKIESVHAILSIKTDSTWVHVQTTSFSKSSINSSPCSQRLCMYKRRENCWVLFLGNYPLSSTHLIDLHFNIGQGNGSTPHWEEEF